MDSCPRRVPFPYRFIAGRFPSGLGSCFHSLIQHLKPAVSKVLPAYCVDIHSKARFHSLDVWTVPCLQVYLMGSSKYWVAGFHGASAHAM